MVLIQKTSLPAGSLLEKYRYHYMDAYSGSKSDDRPMTPEQVARALFRTAPGWIKKLLQLRNAIVKGMGLKTSGPPTNEEELLANFQANIGERVGLFQVLEKSENELIMGETDWHLDFHVSLLITAPATLTMTTIVHFNHWFGRLYFFLVKPFHRLIVPAMLRSLLRELEK